MSLREHLHEKGVVRWLPLRTPTLPPATHTNCVVLGRGDYWLVDPASPWPEEQAALRTMIAERAREGERLTGILLTHHHFDHVSGVVALKATHDVPVYAHAKTRDKLAGIVPVDVLLDDGAALPLDGNWRVVHTPGHAPGHLCALADDGVMIAGDMVAGIGTIVIEPDDDGDMKQYLDSLARMRTLQPTCLVPAHGEPIIDADERLAGYIAHRLAREEKVFAALSSTPRAILDLVPAAYPEIAPAIYPLAARSLLAHLRKLAVDGRAVVDTNGAWSSN